jgi:hypothetical protein
MILLLFMVILLYNSTAELPVSNYNLIPIDQHFSMQKVISNVEFELGASDLHL